MRALFKAINNIQSLLVGQGYSNNDRATNLNYNKKKVIHIRVLNLLKHFLFIGFEYLSN